MSTIYVVHNYDVCNFYTSAVQAQRAVKILRARAKDVNPLQTYKSLVHNIYIEHVKEGIAWGEGVRVDHAETQDILVV